VPGQSYYEASRRLVLRGADGVVFVADSSADRLNANLKAWQDMHEHLASFPVPLTGLPIIVQLNKRDMLDALPESVLRHRLQVNGHPVFEAVALQGKGVFDTLKTVTREVMQNVQKNLN
jgi:signal recognition particle receptor subunit beta